jgi:RHS repeat-associated protein
VLLICFAFPAAATAAECTDTYTGPTEGAWATASNWSAGHAPGESDVACIGSGKTAKITAGTNFVQGVQGAGKVAVRESTLDVLGTGETWQIGSLTLEYQGALTGPATVEVTSALHWEFVSSMSGSGKTVLGPSSVSTLGNANSAFTVAGRRLVNEGTINQVNYGYLNLTENAVFENLGTYNLNAAGSLWQVTGEGTTSVFVNKGTLQKTAGTGIAQVNSSFENLGTLTASTGTLRFEGAGHSLLLAEGSHMQGRIASEKLSAVALDTLTAPEADISFREEPVSIPTGKTASIGTFRMDYEGNLAGAGTLEVTKALIWEGQSTMSGSGKTVLKPGTSNVLSSGATTVTITQRTLVNEGTFTQTASSDLSVKEKGTFKNRGIYDLNSEPSPSWDRAMIKNGSSNTGTFVNSGLLQRTEGALDLIVQVPFENLGQGELNPKSSKIEIEHPEQLADSEMQGCTAGDPVSCASGNFSESQPDIAIGGLGVGLSLTRTYSAQAAAAATSPGAFGYGWSGSFGDHLSVEESGAKVTLAKGNGSTIPFARVSGTTYSGPAWSQTTLAGSPEAGYTFTALDQTAYRFSGAGRLESVTDRNGNETTLAYDVSGRLKTVTDPAGRHLTFAYNAGGQVESVTDPMGHVVKYAYEGGNLTSVTMPGEASSRWQFKYDASHRITQVTNGRGGKTTNEYDSSNRVTSQTDPAGRTITFKYEAFHTTITHKATGAVTDEWFTSYNEPYSITHGYGTASAITETFAYNEAGQMIRRTDGAGHTTTYEYDEAGNRTVEKDPLSHESKWTYNATHDVISTTTPAGETTTIERDANGNVESISRPAPGEETQTATFAHDEHGQLESLTDPLGHTWTYAYDSYGDRTGETDPLGNEQTSAYDADSRVVAITTPRGNVEGAEPAKYTTAVERDLQGRPVKITDPLGQATKFAYDGNGNLATVTDAKNHTTEYTYNADDERTKVKKPNGATLETGYDGAGYVTSQTDGNGKTTTYVRNVLEQPIEVIDPLGRTTVETFDAAGNPATTVDPAKREATYSFDAADRLTGIDYSEEATPDASFEYDADGNLTAMSDGSGESSFAYDQLGRLTRSEDGHGDVVEYAYDLGDQQTGIVYPNGKAVSRSYDAAGRLESVSDWLGGITSFGYDADSNLKGITFPSASGNFDEYAYDAASRMTQATFKKGSETLASASYTRDALGQVEAEARNGLPGPKEVTYGYDENNRLIKAGADAYGYDKADNLTSAPGTTNAYDAASQLQSGTGATYTYDKLGERTSAATVGKGSQFLRYFGGTGSGAGSLSGPRDLDTDKEGNVWVADTAHNRVQEFNPKGEFVRQFGATGSGNGLFNSLRGIAVDKTTGNIYVADTGNRRVQEFNSKGEFIRKWGSLGEGNGQFYELTDLAFDAEGHVWTVEYGVSAASARVQEFTSEGAFITKFGSEGTANGQFKTPEAIAIDSKGNVWVADTGSNRIQEFSSAGTFIRKWGTTGSEAGQLSKPRGIGFDSEGDLWVSDSGNNRLQRFTTEGTYLAQFGSAGNNNAQFAAPRGVAIDAAGNLWIADTGNDRIQESTATEFLRTFGGTGSGAGNLSGPRDLDTDKEGNVWVADTGHSRVQEFNPKGEFVRQFGIAGSGNGMFNSPRGIAVDQASGNVYVADVANNRVQEFNSKGEFIRKWGSAGTGNGQFRELRDLEVDAEGHVWTLELGAETFSPETGEVIRSPRVQEFTSEGTYLAKFGGSEGTANGQFKTPEAIATDAKGNVWVADTANDRIQEFKPSGEFIRKWGTAGSEAGQLSKPRGLVFDSEGDLWVSDSGNNRLQRFTSEGTYLAQFGSAGNEAGQFAAPRGVAVDATGNLWIADTGNDRVQESTATEFLRTFGGAGSGAGNLSGPRGLDADKEGNVWVADTAHNRIQEFDPEGEFLRQVGATGSGNSMFNSPRGIAVDQATGNVYVADTANNRIQEFNSKGEFVRKWGTAGTGNGQFRELRDLQLDAEGHVWTLELGAETFSPETGEVIHTPRVQEFSSAGTYIAQFGSEGTGNGQFKTPEAIATDAKGNVWVADTANNRIQEFKPSGEFIRKWGTTGSEAGQLSKPRGIVFDSEGDLWVSDSGNDRLQRFTPEGTYLAQFGAAGNEAGQLAEPRALALDAAGNLWMADTGNDRVQEWQTEYTTTYAYDQAGNLASVQRPEAGTASINEAFAYDATGLLTAKTSGLSTQHLAWDASTPLPLLLNDGEKSYVYGPNGLPIEQISSGEKPTYLHHDQLGSTRLLTDASGKTSASFSYAPYGELEGTTGTATTPLAFAGQYTDAETGLQYLRARFYDPGTGQFLSRDPLQALTREPYAYAADNPANLVDPEGQEVAVPAIGGTAGSACGGTWEVPGVGEATCGTAGTVALASLADSVFGNDQWIAELEAQVLKAQEDAEEEEDACPPERNWKQDKKVTERELKEAGIDAHGEKRGQKGTDIYKDREGNLYEKPKGGKGPGDPLGINIKDLLR